MYMVREMLHLLSILLLAVSLLECNGIRIRGSTSITYDPSNPTPTELTCEDDSGMEFRDAQWHRLNGSIDTGFVNNAGRLILDPSTIGSSENPQSFEDQYYCEKNGVNSSPVSFHVVPSRISSASTVRHQLGKNVTITCPLRFGYLREDWNVEWTVKDNRNRQVSASRYETRNDPGFQLVINNASVDFEGTTFQCQAFLRNNHPQESQTITLELFHEPEITSSPNNPIVVELTHGTARFEIKAYPRPSIEFCFNNSCYDADGDDPERVQIRADDRNYGTIHTASFTINHMTVEDNGNVTLKVNKNLNSTVMLFKPYKLQVSRNNSVSTNNGPVYLLISLRRPLHFNYEIEFIDNTDKEEVLGIMEGEKGTKTLLYPLTVTKDTEVMARFKVGDARGPNSDPVPVEVQNPDSTNSSCLISVGGAAGVVIILLIIFNLLLCAIMQYKKKLRKLCSRQKPCNHLHDQASYHRTKVNTDKIVDNMKTAHASFVANAIELNDENIYDVISIQSKYNPAYDNVDKDHTTAHTEPTSEAKCSVVNQPQYEDPSFDTTNQDLSYNTVVDQNSNHDSVVDQDPSYDPVVYQEPTTAHTEVIVENKYGVINQPQCDDPAFADQDSIVQSQYDPTCDTIDKDPTTAHIESTGKAKYGVINQPWYNDPSFDTIDRDSSYDAVIDQEPTTAHTELFSGNKRGVINQPQCDDSSFDNVDQDSGHDTVVDTPTHTEMISENQCGVINQPQCDDPTFADQDRTYNVIIQSQSDPTCDTIDKDSTNGHTKLAGEAKYGVINQPQCDDPSFDTIDQDPVIIQETTTGYTDEVKYSIIDQQKCTFVDQDPITDYTKSAGKGKYGVINQPRCNDPSVGTVDPDPTTKSSRLTDQGKHYGVMQ